MIPIDGAIMFEVAPRFSGSLAQKQKKIIDEVGPVLQSTLEEYEIDNRLRIAHFLAQTCHESAGFRTTEEFASGAAYEGRTDLGNTQKGDGKRFKGRGLLQLTGRANYKTYGDAFDIDLIADPTRAAEPTLSLRIACEYWKRKKINPPADKDDVVTVTKLINGGTNGLPDRRQRLSKAKTSLARILGLQVSGASGGSHPVLRRGSDGPAVADLQEKLQNAGYMIAIDSDFGPATELAVTQFQTANALQPDGIVGPATWTALG